MNPFLLTDGYKTGHHKMYPRGTKVVYSNWTPRHGKHSNVKGSKGVISFGQQMVMRQIKEMFDNDFFKTSQRRQCILAQKNLDNFNAINYILNLRQKVCYEIKREYSLYLGEDYDVRHIEALWDLGYLPIKVKSLPEGTFVPYGVPALTIVNTKPDFFWLTNFLETLISNMLWMPMTAATTSYAYKQILSKAALETNKEAIDFVDFQGHNFGMRGMAGIDATIYAGLGHATSFKGDDSLPTILSSRKFYDEKGFVVGSVNATEHSVMCAGTKEDEIETFRYLMKQFPKGILSIVSDTWDLWKVLTVFLPQLKEEILTRDGKIVIRPDSGDPVDIICGTYPGSNYLKLENKDKWTSQEKGVIELLWDIFGGTINDQGCKVLDPHIGAIYGDSITLERADEICKRLEAKGFASTNIVLGIGSYTYQHVTRDTHGFAMKATYCEVESWEYFDNVETNTWVDITPSNMDAIISHGLAPQPQFRKVNKGREIFKDPITDDGGKKSAKGLLMVQKNENDGNLELIDQVSWKEESKGELKTIFVDGEFRNQITLTEIRKRLNENK